MSEETQGLRSLNKSMLWYRGPATIEHGVVCLDLNSKEDSYPVPDDDQLVLDLANIKSHADIVAFVGEYGLLRRGSPDSEHYREPLLDWQKTSGELAMVLGYGTLVKQASDILSAGASTAFETLRDLVLDDVPDRRELLNDRETLLGRFSDLVTMLVNKRLAAVSFGLIDTGRFGPDPLGGFTFQPTAPDLETLAFYRAATMLASGAELRRCENCSRQFAVTDNRQRFCRPKCGNQDRARRFREKRKAAK